MKFEEAWNSVEALREAVAGGYVKPGRDELPLLALAAEVDRLRKNAERYLWLRDKTNPDEDQPYVTVHKMNSWGKWFNTVEMGAALDADVDAAMQASEAAG